MGSAIENGVGLPYRILESSSSSSAASDEWNPTDTVLFFGFSLLLGIACRHLLRGTRVPYTVALLVVGIALGSLEYGTSHKLGRIGDGIRLWAHIDPDLLLAVFLPALLFESSFSMEVHQIKRCMGQMLLLAVPGVLISTCCLGCALKLIFPYNWSWTTSLLLGGLLSATDPVAVVALLKELGASKKLSTIIEGESLMNDGTAIVVYQLFYRMVLGESFSPGAIIKFLTQVSLGAVGIGIAFGIASVLWLGFIFNDTVIEIALTLAVSYVTYFTAQEGAAVSGVLAVMTLGMFYAAVARTAFKGDGQQSLHHFWEMVAYIANTLIFILSGVVIAEGVLSSGNTFHRHAHTWGYLFLLYAFVLLSRFIVVGVLYPILRYFGYGLEWKEAIIVIWSGLRGAVALSLSLSVKRTSDSSVYLSSDTGTLFVFFTGGIVFLTLIVNGSTTQFILHLLDMDKLSATKKRLLNFTKYEMLNKALEAFGDLGEDEELGPVDWPTVKRYIPSLNNLEGSCEHPHGASEADNNLDPTNLKDIRIRLLNGVQAAYWGMLDEGRITQTTANILMQSVDEAIDLASHEPLCDWKGLRSNVHFPNYYKFLQASIFPQKMVTYFTVERLESACYICAAFLRAHRIARRQLHDFIGDSGIASLVINESNAEGEEARKFLEDVRVTFPQVLRVVKTRQATYSVLNHLIDYVQNLEKVGLLEEKEMLHLHDAVQTDLKRFLRNPPLVMLPKITDLISVHPLLEALPSIVREPLERSSKEIMKPRGVPLYKEGSKPNGVWLISSGVVKWTSKSVRSKHSLHPTFTHGSTLGLYELLVGKRCICDIITDSVVFCFFIESENMLSLLGSDPAIEDFLWQESAIVIAKLLLPQVFEKMPMQELRALVAERSVMTTYLRGETIEIPHHSIGFLLEGFIKAHGFQDELIASPAVLLPPQGNQSFQKIGMSGAQAASFSHQGSRYQVEARARVIIFDIAAFEADGALRRGSSSLVLGDHPHRYFTREHGGLMSWPENFYKPREREQNGVGTSRSENSLSVRAMQLSIFGSMVDMRRHAHSFSGSQVKRSHSLSVLRNASYQQVRVPSDEATYARKSLEVRKLIGKTHAPPPQSTGTNETRIIDNYSDESDAEDELVVRIDSPRTLSFHHAS
uniref:Na+/H+ antiporter n=3 Tax=Populus TaxID=3689 RepID=A0A1S5VAN7_POPEU|nr:Na+/H+ antiporter [Populus euphratica]AQN76689.1 Na+/H+ antiporter [Populus euphratica]AQN76690.1 Na+/H+ antiporter [Populus euphratica]AQN76691.1 Na+/H+ antiporter [Populus euphratica]AQN76692.1 Na+/H+ antiporter [Populus euphratica]